MLRIIQSAALYFALVFGAGFVLGVIRVLFVAPHLGARTAELIEMPIMFVVILAAARWIVRRAPAPASTRLAIGFLALTLTLAVEFSFVLWFLSLTLVQYVHAMDPVSGTFYFALLAVFAILPAVLPTEPRS